MLKNELLIVYSENIEICENVENKTNQISIKSETVERRKKTMFLKMVKNDFIRNKMVTIAVFVFITMAIILAASAINNIANLIQSMSDLEEKAVPADITQMHIGEFDQTEIDQFTKEQQEHIAMQETMTLLNIDGSQYSFWSK